MTEKRCPHGFLRSSVPCEECDRKILHPVYREPSKALERERKRNARPAPLPPPPRRARRARRSEPWANEIGMAPDELGYDQQGRPVF